MEKVSNSKELDQYIQKYNMNEIFSKDMKPFMDLLNYKKNEHMMKDSEEINYLLFLVEGKAKVYVTLSNGKSLLLCFYQGFMMLGDLEILNSNHAISNVQVIEETYCIGISFENVRKYLLEDAKFLRYICSSLGRKLIQCSNNSSINLLYSLENRLAGYILTTGEIIHDQGREAIMFDENLTQIAELLGTSYRHLLRTLNFLCKKGILRKEKQGYYQVINIVELRRLSADLYQ
jgi:CRP-like cAMP-binding protein